MLWIRPHGRSSQRHAVAGGRADQRAVKLPGVLSNRRESMLERLELKNVGPSSAMAFDLAPRLNLITGDNGLGKSFLLDIAWWALTRRWPRELNPRLTAGYMARPKDVELPAKLGFKVRTKTGRSVEYESEYSSLDEALAWKTGQALEPGARCPRPCRRRLFGLGSGEKLLEKNRERGYPGTTSRLRLFSRGGLVWIGRPG